MLKLSSLLFAIFFLSCGPHQQSNVPYAIDCFDGCSATYKQHVDKFKGEKGDSGEKGSIGKTGAVGSSGSNGVSGVDGASCSQVPIPEGVEITCGNSVVVITNGKDGVDGSNGTDGADASLEMIDLCDNGKEFLVRLPDGRLLAHFVSGDNNYFSILVPGSYRSTDGMECNFTIDSDNIVTYN